jgi:hypothetical protein
MPATLTCDLASESRLAVVRRNHRLEVRDDGLELGDEERPSRAMKSQDVDGAPFAADRERCLDCDLPSEFRKSARHPVGQTSVAVIEESIEVRSVPTEPDVECRTQHGRSPFNRRQ